MMTYKLLLKLRMLCKEIITFNVSVPSISKILWGLLSWVMSSLAIEFRTEFLLPLMLILILVLFPKSVIPFFGLPFFEDLFWSGSRFSLMALMFEFAIPEIALLQGTSAILIGGASNTFRKFQMLCSPINHIALVDPSTHKANITFTQRCICKRLSGNGVYGWK